MRLRSQNFSSRSAIFLFSRSRTRIWYLTEFVERSGALLRHWEELDKCPLGLSAVCRGLFAVENKRLEGRRSCVDSDALLTGSGEHHNQIYTIQHILSRSEGAITHHFFNLCLDAVMPNATVRKTMGTNVSAND